VVLSTRGQRGHRGDQSLRAPEGFMRVIDVPMAATMPA